MYTSITELTDQIAALQAERDLLALTLLEANSQCRSSFQVADRITKVHGGQVLETSFGYLRDRLEQSLKAQHVVLQPYHVHIANERLQSPDNSVMEFPLFER